MLKETAILRPALWAPKYLGGRIVFRLRFRLKTFVLWRKKYEAKSFFLFSQLGRDQIWQCFKDLLSKADKLFQFSFGSWDIPIVGYLTLLVTQGIMTILILYTINQMKTSFASQLVRQFSRKTLFKDGQSIYI